MSIELADFPDDEFCSPEETRRFNKLFERVVRDITLRALEAYTKWAPSPPSWLTDRALMVGDLDEIMHVHAGESWEPKHQLTLERARACDLFCYLGEGETERLIGPAQDDYPHWHHLKVQALQLETLRAVLISEQGSAAVVDRWKPDAAEDPANSPAYEPRFTTAEFYRRDKLALNRVAKNCTCSLCRPETKRVRYVSSSRASQDVVFGAPAYGFTAKHLKEVTRWLISCDTAWTQFAEVRWAIFGRGMANTPSYLRGTPINGSIPTALAAWRLSRVIEHSRIAREPHVVFFSERGADDVAAAPAPCSQETSERDLDLGSFAIALQPPSPEDNAATRSRRLRESLRTAAYTRRRLSNGVWPMQHALEKPAPDELASMWFARRSIRRIDWSASGILLGFGILALERQWRRQRKKPAKPRKVRLAAGRPNVGAANKRILIQKKRR